MSVPLSVIHSSTGCRPVIEFLLAQNDSQMNAKRSAIFLLIAGFVVILCTPFFRFVRTDDLNQAAKAGDVKRVAYLLSTGAAINGRGMHDMTPLMSACAGGDLATVQYLISVGADVNGHNNSGSALMWAIDSGNDNIVKLLLENGVNKSWKNVMGADALTFARDEGHSDIMTLLQ